jgi:hypothetical protein
MHINIILPPRSKILKWLIPVLQNTVFWDVTPCSVVGRYQQSTPEYKASYLRTQQSLHSPPCKTCENFFQPKCCTHLTNSNHTSTHPWHPNTTYYTKMTWRFFCNELCLSVTSSFPGPNIFIILFSEIINLYVPHKWRYQFRKLIEQSVNHVWSEGETVWICTNSTNFS